MARSKTYGTTWWGRNWLASLTHIDNANRIPRGRSYANTGKVFDVDISPQQGRITAKVKGKYYPYYRVVLKFEQVPQAAKDAFLSDLVKNITIVSKLTNRELDPSLLDLALAHNIKLFPSSWKDLGMTCNCPDFAVPCKHIAAVIYIVSEVIDSNPFYVFSLKGIDLLKELENRGFNLDEATRVETATFESLTQNSITTIENLCAQAQEFDMQLEPVIITRTVPVNWQPDFTTGSCYDVDAIVDVDTITSALQDASSDETVAPEPQAEAPTETKRKGRRKAKSATTESASTATASTSTASVASSAQDTPAQEQKTPAKTRSRRSKVASQEEKLSNQTQTSASSPEAYTLEATTSQPTETKVKRTRRKTNSPESDTLEATTSQPTETKVKRTRRKTKESTLVEPATDVEQALNALNATLAKGKSKTAKGKQSAPASITQGASADSESTVPQSNALTQSSAQPKKRGRRPKQ